MKIINKDILLIPNILSLLRLFCAIPLFFILKTKIPELSSLFILWIIIILTDFFDGITARKFNQSSELGRILDPLADKVVLFAAMLSLLIAGKIPASFFILMAGKDILIFSGGMYIVSKTGKVVPSNWWGKWTSTLLAFGFGLYVLIPSLTVEAGISVNLQKVLLISGLFLLGLGFLFTFLTAASYLSVFFEEVFSYTKKQLKKTGLYLYFISCILAACFLIFFYLPFIKTVYTF